MYKLDSFTRKKNYLKYAMPYGIIVEEKAPNKPQIIINKDGSMQTTWAYRGPDLESAVPEQLGIITAQLNSAFMILGTSYVMYFEAQRRASTAYPQDTFPDAVTQAIDDERRDFFESGINFESDYYMTLYWLPPTDNEGKMKEIFIEGHKRQKLDMEDYLKLFQETAEKIYTFFKSLRMPTHYLNKDETITYLHSIVSNNRNPVIAEKIMLDNYMYDTAFTGGLEPQLDNLHIRIVVPLDYPPVSTFGMFDDLNRLDFEYRWVTRFYCMDKTDTLKTLSDFESSWKSKLKSLMATLKELFFGHESEDNINLNALNKVNEVKAALNMVEGDEVGYGYYSTMVVLTDENAEIVNEKAKAVEQIFLSLGIKSKIEGLNSVDAWQGSLPGNVGRHIRRPLVSTANLVHMLPITNVWAGPNRDEHLKASCLMYTRSGNTPFRFNIHVGDVGHTLLIGPTGAGKSVHLNMIAAQFRRYKNAQVFIFDKGASSRVLTEAVGGKFYDIANEKGQLSFQPLSQIDDENERAWAKEWLCDYLASEKVQVTPEIKNLLEDALNTMAAMPVDRRTISLLISSVQNKELKIALRQLSLEGNYGRIFDSDHDNLKLSTWQSFEMERLMSIPSLVAPTLFYIFHRIEQQLTGAPTEIILDECWAFFDNEIFGEKIRKWLKELRKYNASVVFATQSLADVVGTKIFSTILESCQTRVFLPNDKALEKSTREHYTSFGLNERQIQIIASAIPKREYYYTSPAGSRLYELALGKTALSYVAINKNDLNKCEEIISEYGQAEFVNRWQEYKKWSDDNE